MKFLIAGINIVILFLLIYRFRPQSGTGLGHWYWPALLFKLFAGIMLGVLYRYYYTEGDTFTFFKDAGLLSHLARKDPGTYLRFLWSGNASFPVWGELNFHQLRSLFMIKCISLVNLLTYDNYWITSLYFSLTSFAGAWFLMRTLIRFLPGSATAALIAFLFFPSVVFWSAGIIKESLSMAALFFLSGLFLKAWFKERPEYIELLLLLPALWVLWKLKYYYAGVLLPVATASLIVRYLAGQWNIALQVLLWLGVFILPLFLLSFFHPNFNLHALPGVMVDNYKTYLALSAPDNVIRFRELQPTAGNLLENAPWALFSAVFRPFLWESGSLFKIIIALENAVIAAFFLTSLTNIRKLATSPNRMLVFALLMYIFILGAFLALSAPNFGTLARYRIGFLPFFIFLVTFKNPLERFIAEMIQRAMLRLVP